MSKIVFQKIREMAKAGELSDKTALKFGFEIIKSDKIPKDDVFAVVVMGAGPSGFGFVKQLIDSGSIAADKENPPIMVLECGEKIGTRSVYGGAFWPKDNVIFPDDPNFFDDCPHDRTITKKTDNLHLIDKTGKMFTPPMEPATLFRNKSVGYMTPKTVLYPYFWEKLDQKRQDGFFKLRTSQTCEKLILNENGAVVGVKTTTGQRYFAKVVVDGTGCGATFSKHLAERRLDNRHGDYFFGVKLVCEMDNKKINELYGYEDDKEGGVLEFAGSISERLEEFPGIIGIYPGNGTLNITLLYEPDFGFRCGMQPHQIMNEVLANPAVAKYTGGSKPVEWSACRLPELHFKYMPRWVHDGYIPLGDTLGLLDFLRKHGVNTAMASGVVAAETVATLLKGNKQATMDNLASYESGLKKSWVGKRLMSSSFKLIHKSISNPLFYKAMAKAGSMGKAVDTTGIEPLPAMSHSDYMALNAEGKGQPDVIIKNPMICSGCAAESCMVSDPCQAVLLDKFGIPTLDPEPVEPPHLKEMRKAPGTFKLVNAEGCLECGNCESACPYDNLIYRVPNNLKGHGGVKNRGITYKYN